MHNQRLVGIVASALNPQPRRWRADMRIGKAHIACFLLLWILTAGAIWQCFLRLHWSRKSVNPSKWASVEVGMTKKQVRWLLGAPSDTVRYKPTPQDESASPKPDPAPRGRRSRAQRYPSPAHFWEFGDGGGFIPLTFRDAPRPNYSLHVIHFDQESKVRAKEEPSTQPY